MPVHEGRPNRFIRAPTAAGARYGIALGALAAATLIQAALLHVFAGAPYLIFYPAVVAAAAFGGFGPALLATIGSTLIVDALFVTPEGVLTLFHDPVYFSRSLVFAVGGVMIGAVAEKYRAARRREQEQAQRLQESEQKLRTVADHTSAWEFWLSPEGQFLYNSPSCKEVTGYEAREFLSDPKLFNRILYSKDRAIFENHRETGQEESATKEVEFRIIRADGSIRWLTHACVPVYGEGGEFLGRRGSNRDVTENKRVQSALRESEQRLRTLFNSVGVGILEAGRDYRFVAANDCACEILGRSREEIMGMTVHDLTWPEDRPLSDRLNAELHEGTRRWLSYEKRYLKGDGSPLWVHVTISAIRDEAGRWVRSIATVQDISERKQVEEALKDSEAQFRQLAETMPQLVWMTRPDGYHEYFNQRWYAYTGKTLSETQGELWACLLHPDDYDRTLECWHHSLKTGEPYQVQYRLRGAGDGAYRWFLGRALPIRDESGNIIRWFGTSTDIHEQKQAQEQLEASQRELAEARGIAERAKAVAEQANSAKDRFLAVLSHELRTPLAPVLASVSLLQKNPFLDEQVHRDLEMIRRNIELEARLIDDLLDLTRIARGKIELNKRQVNLCEILERAIEVCHPDLSARELSLDVDLGGDTPHILEADAARLQQVFWNLLKNSIKFTPRGGRLRIRCYRDGEAVVAEVNDTGVGIEPKALPHIFDAFAQADPAITRQFGGLGLGLAISRSLVELHGGTIEAHSPGKGKGSTFRVRLPLHPSGMPDVAAVHAPSGQPPLRQNRRLRILVVEDHRDTAEMMRALLEYEGHEVEVAGNIEAGLNIAHKEDFDLLISDLGLPDGSGLDLIRELRARGQAPPAIALSGYGQERDVQQSREAGFSAHLTKPVDPDRLMKVVNSVLSPAGQYARQPGSR